MRSLAARERTAAVCREAAELHVAWKTGTSSGHRDAWCAAVGPGGLTVVAWLGNADGKSSMALVGQDAAAPLALKLIAALGRNAAVDWPALDAEMAAPINRERSRSAKANISSARLVIVSPTLGTLIQTDPDLNADRQRIALQAACRSTTTNGQSGSADTQIWWFVDGTLLGQGRIADPFWWIPVPGDHELRVTDVAGRSATVRVAVRDTAKRAE
jgi:membrane carboxypeptidase/penicillin-binding protein PbpC